MPVPSSVSTSGPYLANGVTTTFARTFLAFAEDHVRVWLTIGEANFEVLDGIEKGGLGQPTGDVVFLEPPPAGALVTLLRAVPLVQDSDYSSQGAVSPEQIEQDLDLTTMRIQDLAASVGRVPRLPVSSTVVEASLPVPMPGKALIGRADGKGWENADAAESIGQGAAFVVSPKDFGAKGDGLTDDRAAIQAAIDYGAANRVKVRISAGQYAIWGQINTRTNLHLEFDNGAWLLPKALSQTGSIITNVVFGDEAARVQDNILIENPQIDGIGRPLTRDDNAIGFARGASNVRILGGVIRNFPFVYAAGGAGGKAVGMEGGVVDSLISGVTAENCGMAVFIQGADGTWPSGQAKRASRIVVSDILARNCEVAVALLGINASAHPDGDPDDMLCLVDGVTFYNCGHAPNRPMTSAFCKAAPIMLGECQNVRIDNIKGHNAAGYPASWPAAGTDVAGAGLSGPVGAVIHGWGRNISVGSVEYHGACDHLIRIARARAVGEDGAASAPGDVAGQIRNVFRFDVDGLKHYGTAKSVVAFDDIASLRPPVGEMTGRVTALSDALSEGLMDASVAGFTGLIVEVIDAATGRSIRGTASGIQTSRNTFGNPQGFEQLVNGTFHATVLNARRIVGPEFTIPDNGAASFEPAATSGLVVVASDASLLRVLVSFRAIAGLEQCDPIAPTSVAGFATTTGALTGTTGAPGAFTVSAHSDGRIYLENRRGAALTVTVTPLG